jgi:methionyl-tRNA formyltransferase
MSNSLPGEQKPRVLFFGMEGAFSSSALAALLSSGVEVCALVVPGGPIAAKGVIERRDPPRLPRTRLPLINTSLQSSLVEMAWQRQIPVWEVLRLGHPDTIKMLAAYQADLLCVACFSLLIPESVLRLPRLGCLNVHPSLLPVNRGPVPLFWTFRQGCETTGVTIHLMDEGMDSGAILAQETIMVPDGISYARLEAQCARRGGELLANVVHALYAGNAIATPQNEAQSSYHSFPTDEDFVIDPSQWDARHVYNFICGVGNWDRPLDLHIQGKSFLCRTAISYSTEDVNEGKQEPYYWQGDLLVVRCRVGEVSIYPVAAGR